MPTRNTPSGGEFSLCCANCDTLSFVEVWKETYFLPNKIKCFCAFSHGKIPLGIAIA
jgi:hypothetical protein